MSEPKKRPGCLFCCIDQSDAPEGTKRMAYSLVSHFAIEKFGVHPAEFTDACSAHCEDGLSAGILVTSIVLSDKEAKRAADMIDKLKVASGRGQG